MRARQSNCGLPTEPIRVPGIGRVDEEGGRAGLGHPHAVADPDAEVAAGERQRVAARARRRSPNGGHGRAARRRSGDGRAGPDRRSARRRRCRAAAPRAGRRVASASNPSMTITRPPAIRVGRAWRLIPAVWKSGRKVERGVGRDEADRAADIEVVRERHPEGVDHPLGPAGRPRRVDQIPGRGRRPARAPAPGRRRGEQGFVIAVEIHRRRRRRECARGLCLGGAVEEQGRARHRRSARRARRAASAS